MDAHTDTYEPYLGSKVTHGTTFRLAVEEGLLDTARVIQIGLRGSGYGTGDAKWGIDRVTLIWRRLTCDCSWNFNYEPGQNVRGLSPESYIYTCISILI